MRFWHIKNPAVFAYRLSFIFTSSHEEKVSPILICTLFSISFLEVSDSLTRITEFLILKSFSKATELLANVTLESFAKDIEPLTKATELLEFLTKAAEPFVKIADSFFFV